MGVVAGKVKCSVCVQHRFQCERDVPETERQKKQEAWCSVCRHKCVGHVGLETENRNEE